jgi:hypothetical protein
MTDNLFDIPESPSPRLQWLRDHQIDIIDNGIDYEPGDCCSITGNRLFRYWAIITDSDGGHKEAGGDTEDEAIVELARKLNLKLWNEA